MEITKGLKWISLTLSTGKKYQNCIRKVKAKDSLTFLHFWCYRFDFFRSDDDHYDPNEEDPEVNTLFGGEPDPGWNLSNPSFNVTREEEEEDIPGLTTPARPPPQTSKIYNLSICLNIHLEHSQQASIFSYRHQ